MSSRVKQTVILKNVLFLEEMNFNLQFSKAEQQCESNNLQENHEK